VRWGAFWALCSLLVLASTTLVPPLARVLWIAALGGLVALRWRRAALLPREQSLDRAARAAVAAVALYMAAMLGASAAARVQVRAALAAQGVAPVERVMVAPVAANPFAGDVVAVTAGEYRFGRWRWLAEPHLELEAEALPRPSGAVYEAAARTRDAQLYLSWSRFPLASVEPDGDGFIVTFDDARYRAPARIEGPVVRVDGASLPR
jgi:hypothetical protein